MPHRSERGRELAERMPRGPAAALFLLRNLVLYFLLVNAFLQLRDELDLVFQSAAFLVAVLAALWMEKSRLRFLPSLALAAALPVALRALFFLVFRLQRAIASAPATDFLFLYFDKDFFPALAATRWRGSSHSSPSAPGVPLHRGGAELPAPPAGFLDPGGLPAHPLPPSRRSSRGCSPFSSWRSSSCCCSPAVRTRDGPAEGTDAERVDARAVLSFSWILVPLLLVFLLFLLGRYGEGAVKAGGGLMKPTLFRFDFAPYVRLESEIRTSDEAVLLFRTEGKAERFLLRRFVLSGYDAHQGFSMERGKDMDEYPPSCPTRRRAFPIPATATGRRCGRSTSFSPWTPPPSSR